MTDPCTRGWYRLLHPIFTPLLVIDFSTCATFFFHSILLSLMISSLNSLLPSLLPLSPTVYILFSLPPFVLFLCLLSFSAPFLLLVAPCITPPNFSPLCRTVPPRFRCSPRGAHPQPVCMSVCAPVHGQISLSSELQPGS